MRKIVSIAIFFIILVIIFSVIINAKSENEIKTTNEIKKENVFFNVAKNNNISHNQLKEQKTQDLVGKIPDEYKGYNVTAKLEIPKIKLETYVLKNYSLSALNASVTKYWGCEPNEIGNFCIAGHNWNVKNMFSKVKNLKINDEIFLLDNKNGKTSYKIYSIYKVNPNNVECLEQQTNGKVEITLITCTSDSKLRIIVKATKN